MYAYMNDLLPPGLVPQKLLSLWPFAPKAYTEENFLPSITEKIADIRSTNYALSGDISVAPRDSDAIPFKLILSNELELKQKYANDKQRFADVTRILSVAHTAHQQSGKYVATLGELKLYVRKSSSYGLSSSTWNERDPLDLIYTYRSTNSGQGFELTVTFETSKAVRTAKGSSSASRGTVIEGRTVRFTEESGTYFYFNEKQLEPLIVQLTNALRNVTSDFHVAFTISGVTERGEAAPVDTRFRVSAEMNLGDLIAVLDAEAVKKDDDYFVRINKFPAIFTSALSILKGQWVKIGKEDREKNASSLRSYIGARLPGATEDARSTQQEAAEELKIALYIANEEHLFAFAKEPSRERVGERSAIRYELTPTKEALVRFFERLSAELAKRAGPRRVFIFDDEGFLEYLQSPEFDQVFEYFVKNSFIVVWTDQAGYPIKAEYILRLVPPDTAIQLSGKQIRSAISLELSAINEPIQIAAPEASLTLEEAIKLYTENNSRSF